MTTTRKQPTKRRDRNDLTDLRVDAYCRVSRDSSGHEKSVNDQEALFTSWAEREGVRVGHVHRDVSLSASAFARKKRPEFQSLLHRIEGGETELVWLWALNRAARRTVTFGQFVETCQAAGVNLIVDGRLYDLTDDGDLMQLDIQASMDASYSRKLSKDVLRGKASGARAGRPAGRVPYGYRRVYDPATGKSSHDVPDTWDGNGRPVENSPAFVVKDIFTRLAGGSTILSIFRDLNERRVPTPAGNGSQWYHSTLRMVAKNPAYVGLRTYQGKILDGVAGFGPPLVDPETFWAVQRIITDESRSTWRAAPPSTALVSSLARCAECGALLIQGKRLQRGQPVRFYHCREKDCATIDTLKLDPYVEEQIVDWLSDPDVAATLTAGDHSEAAKLARADAARARSELDEWRHLIARGEITATGYAVAEKAILARIHAADETAQAATMPVVVRGKLGRQAKSGWKKLDRDAKRTVIRAVADIRLKRSERWQRGPSALPVQDRIEWRWLLTPKSAHE